MKAAVVVGVNDIRVEDIPEPDCPAKCVKVRVSHCGICGSDIPRVLNGACHAFPQILGHEFSGVIAEIGEGVTSVEKGAHVVGIPLVPCFSCYNCANGDFSLCEKYSFVGSRQPGAMAEYVVLPESNVLAIDTKLPLDCAALVEPATVAIHGILKAGFADPSDKNVLVLGAGTIAIFAIQWFKILGAKNITVISRSHEGLTVAKQYGAEVTFSTLDDNYINEAWATTDGKGYSFVYDAVGSEETLKTAMRLVSCGGAIGMVGTPTKELSFSIKEWELLNRKEMCIKGSWMSYSAPWPGKEWHMTVEQMVSGGIVVGNDMIYSHFPLDKIKHAFKEYEKRRSRIRGRIIVDI